MATETHPVKIDEIIAAIKDGSVARPEFDSDPSLRPETPPLHVGKQLRKRLGSKKTERAFDEALRKQAVALDALRRELVDGNKGHTAPKSDLIKGIDVRVPAFPGDRLKRYYVNRPYLIWSRGDLDVVDTIANGASSVKFRVDTTSAVSGYVEFWFLWTNDTGQPVTINIDGYLIADGYVEIESEGGYLWGHRDASVNLTAEMFPFEVWHPSLTPVLPVQPSQIQNVTYMHVDSGGLAAGAGFDARTIFRGYDLQYHGLTVPANGSVVVEVEFAVSASVHHGRAQVDFGQGARDLISPGVLITVLS